MRTPVTDTQPGFQGGLNTTADDPELGETEIRRAENARLTVFGAVQKRYGTQRIHASAIGSGNPVRGGFAWKRIGSTTEMALSNGALHVASYAIPTTWTAKIGAFDAAAYPSFAPFRDGSAEVCYIADGGQLNKYDGTNVTVNIASTPNVARIAVQNQRLFGISGTDQTLYYSALNNGDTLGTGVTDSGSAVIRTFGNQELRGLLALGESLVLFHRDGISRFTGYTYDDISLSTGTRGISSDVGTIAPDSIVAVENTGYFLTDRGVYQVTESGVKPISSKIESVIASLDQSLFLRVKSVHSRAYREIWFYFPDVGVYVYNYRLDAWTGPMNGVYTTGTTTYALWQSLDATAKPIVLMGGGDGFVRRTDAPSLYKDDVLSDSTGGTSYAMQVQLRRFFFGTPEEEKMFRKLEIHVRSTGQTTYTISYVTSILAAAKTLPSLVSGTWGTGTWGTGVWGSTGAGSYEIQIAGRGTYMDVTLTEEGLGLSTTSRIAGQGVSYGKRYGAV